jgi:protein-S-isoprenylcysteine O-methyltransferase Ste14
MLLYHRGLWPVYMTYAAKWTNQPILSSLAALSPLAVSNYARVNPTFLGIDAAIWVTVAGTALTIRMIMRRVVTEEKMLKQHFGRDWDEYASKRWRFIPFLY